MPLSLREPLLDNTFGVTVLIYFSLSQQYPSIARLFVCPLPLQRWECLCDGPVSVNPCTLLLTFLFNEILCPQNGHLVSPPHSYIPDRPVTMHAQNLCWYFLKQPGWQNRYETVGPSTLLRRVPCPLSPHFLLLLSPLYYNVHTARWELKSFLR